jgi:hypothetical protein
MELNKVLRKTVGAKNFEVGQNRENYNEKLQRLYSRPAQTRAKNIAVPSIHTVYEK